MLFKNQALILYKNNIQQDAKKEESKSSEKR